MLRSPRPIAKQVLARQKNALPTATFSPCWCCLTLLFLTLWQPSFRLLPASQIGRRHKPTKENFMKRVLTALFAFLLTASLSLVAQEPASKDKDQGAGDKKVQKAEKTEAKAAAKDKSISLTGWVKDQEGKPVFEN